MRRGASFTIVASAVVAIAAFGAGDARAQSQDQIKPYILLVLDISGSMDDSTGAGVPSCGGDDTRIDHAKCAIWKLVNTYGDVEFGFGRFRDDACTGTCNSTGVDCNACDNGNGAGCTAAMRSADRFELLVPLHEESSESIATWVDLSCGAGGCSYDPADDPEIDTAGFTPLGGAIRGAQRYFLGNEPGYATNLQPLFGAAAGTPIASDPVNDVFIDGEQCRPYTVILLTDGAETCSVFDDGDRSDDDTTIDAVTNMLSTSFGGSVYRIETKPIGFGITAPNTQIEAMAQAGGEPNLAGNEGFYATDEASLTAAFNQIVLDSIKVEICNGVDDDCDGLIDEGFQLYCDADGVLGDPIFDAELCVDPGDDCDGIDDNCVLGTSDEPVNDCGFCGPLPTESCNLLDDDCDGTVDEDGTGVPGSLCAGCVPTGGERCNGLDDDCDGVPDDNLTRPCGSDLGECVAGEEICVDGEWTGCDAVTGTAEVCDSQDDDCDGTADDFQQECYALPGNGPGLFAPCQPGVQICAATADGPGGPNPDLGPCLGEIGPGTESCNGLDDDCDGEVDEGMDGGACDDQCGPGVYDCQGADGLVCIPSAACSDEICDGIDNDGDGVIDDGIPPGGECFIDEDGAELCLPGQLICVAGDFECIGGTPPATEVCDCLDNDCEGGVDEDPNGDLCPTGTFCVDCGCRLPCGDDEFACDAGEICVDDFCEVDPCFQVDCAPVGGAATECVEGECVPVCENQTCTGGRVCRPSDGQCVENSCSFLPDLCTGTEVCLAGECVADLCAGVTCDVAGEYCYQGDCVGSCAGIDCPDGESCRFGACAADLCEDTTCNPGTACDPASGDCVTDRCEDDNVRCGSGQVCNPVDGTCGTDPCLGVECPSGQTCTGGSCFDSSQVLPDGGLLDHDYVSVGGGGGCAVAAGSGLGAFLLLALLGAFAMLGRRKAEVRR